MAATAASDIEQRRNTAARIYMEHRSARKNFREAFTHVGIKDWNSVSKKNGHGIVDIIAETSGCPSSCIAIQRDTNVMHRLQAAGGRHRPLSSQPGSRDASSS